MTSLLLAILALALVWGVRANLRRARADRGSIVPAPGWPPLVGLFVVLLAWAGLGAVAALVLLCVAVVVVFRGLRL
jgi:hypothetical protein